MEVWKFLPWHVSVSVAWEGDAAWQMLWCFFGNRFSPVHGIFTSLEAFVEA